MEAAEEEPCAALLLTLDNGILTVPMALLEKAPWLKISNVRLAPPCCNKLSSHTNRSTEFQVGLTPPLVDTGDGTFMLG